MAIGWRQVQVQRQSLLLLLLLQHLLLLIWLDQSQGVPDPQRGYSCDDCCKKNPELACCKEKDDASACLGLSCCRYDDLYIASSPIWYPCLPYYGCRSLNPKGLCLGEVSTSYALGAQFQCTDSCCSLFLTNANKWSTSRLYNSPGQKNVTVEVTLDPLDYTRYLDSQNTLGGTNLDQMVVEIPKGWSMDGTQCFLSFSMKGDKQEASCTRAVWSSTNYVIMKMPSTPSSPFQFILSGVSTPQSLTLPNPENTRIHFLFQGQRNVFSSYLLVDALEPGVIAQGMFYPSAVYPGAIIDGLLSFSTQGEIPKNGFIELYFESDWMFFRSTKWWLLNPRSNAFHSISVDGGSEGLSSHTWRLQVPFEVPLGWLQIRVETIRSPLSSFKNGPKQIGVRTMDSMKSIIDVGSIPTSMQKGHSMDREISPYNYVSMVIFFICLAFCGTVTHMNKGLQFSSLSIWTDLTALSAMVALSIDIVNNLIWIVHPSKYYFVISRVRLIVVFIMLVSVAFHWGTVLSLRLRKVPRVTTGVAFFLLVGLFGTFQFYVLMKRMDVIDEVYQIELSPQSPINQRCEGLKDTSDYVYSDIQASLWYCYLREVSNKEPNAAFYHWLSLGIFGIFVFVNMVVMSLGFMVLRRGKSIAKTLIGAEQVILRQALRLYYTLIGVVTFTYLLAWIMQLFLTNTYVDYPWWYIFVVWLPNAIPPSCFVFLQWNSAASSLRINGSDATISGNEVVFQEVRTPSFAFSLPDMWSPRDSLTSATEDFTKLSAQKGIAGRPPIGLSMQFRTEREVKGGIFVSVEFESNVLGQTDTVPTTETDGKYEFVAVPQVTLPDNSDGLIRFVVQEDLMNVSIPSADEADDLEEDFNEDDSDDEIPSECSQENQGSSCLCTFSITTGSLLEAIRNQKTIDLTFTPSDLENPSDASESAESSLHQLSIAFVSSVARNAEATSVQRQFHIQSHDIFVVENLVESIYATSVPRMFLEVTIRRRMRDVSRAKQDLCRFEDYQRTRVKNVLNGMYETLIDQIQDSGDVEICREWLKKRVDQREKYLCDLRLLRRMIVMREHEGVIFKPSVEKKNEATRCLALNLHVQEMRAGSKASFISPSLSGSQPKTYRTVTVGAMSAHSMKFKNGGILTIQNQLSKLRIQHNYWILSSYHETPEWTEMERVVDDMEWDILHRMDVCLPQAVSALVTSFACQLEHFFTDFEEPDTRVFLRLLQSIGFIFSVESLLSTHGAEIGMLEDMMGAVSELEFVKILLVAKDDESATSPFSISDVQIFSNLSEALGHSSRCTSKQFLDKSRCEHAYIVRVSLNNVKNMVSSEEGMLIGVRPVLFTQGINEKQTIANTTGASILQLQDDINEMSFKKLEEIVREWKLFEATNASPCLPQADIIDSVMVELESCLHSGKGKKKRPEILQMSSDVCRLLEGGRVTVCKSAKDRTSMSVTLEQGRILVNHHGLPKRKQREVVSVMRSRGVRIENAKKNTGRRVFAFNALQRSLLPEEYRCPPGTGGSNMS